VSRVEKTVEVDVPVRTAYNQWTQFEEFPRFMEGVEQVRQLDDTHLHWVANVAGRRKEWDARIVEQIPDQIIAWKTEDGAENGGTVRFFPEGANRSRVMVVLNHDPENVVERVGSALGFASGQIEDDLKRFKEFIESRGTETGAWRGQVQPGGQTTPAGSGSFPGADATAQAGGMGTPQTTAQTVVGQREPLPPLTPDEPHTGSSPAGGEPGRFPARGSGGQPGGVG
jgi:uncharacterized membrane protein